MSVLAGRFATAEHSRQSAQLKRSESLTDITCLLAVFSNEWSTWWPNYSYS
jgi:hypothetical protein